MVSAIACLFAKPAVLVLAGICAVNIVVRLSAPMTGLLRTTSWLAFETDQTNELARMLYEYVNLFFLLDVNAFLSSLELLRRQRGRIRDLFEVLGEIDGALSVASFRSSLPVWCRPTLGGAGGALRLDGGFHPLLREPVANSIAALGRAVLVTGSNMAGKTTFIKTVGLNALLAQTIFTCPARAWEAPWLGILSAIGRTESLSEGTSYYLAEVRRVKELVEASGDDEAHLILLDELFRGTNTVERIAAGKAVLDHLGRGAHVVFASTHDIELVPLLAGSYRPFHFRESLVDGKLVFDFLIHPGPSSTHSAIALLASAGFPASLVADALETADVLTRPESTSRPAPLPASS